MSKFLPQKKKLLEEVFEKASRETPEKSFSGILKSLETSLFEDFRIRLSYKTFENYYIQIVKNDQDYNIKTTVLNELSQYLEYEDFSRYCAEWKTVEHTVTQKASQIVVHVVNKPVLMIPEFLTKQSNLGIIGVLLVGGYFAGNQVIKSDNKDNTPVRQTAEITKSKEEVPANLAAVPLTLMSPAVRTSSVEKAEVRKRECMFWDEDHYKTAYCDENPEGKNLIAYQEKASRMVKITRPDTLTVENAFGKVWYDKSDHEVEFFMGYGTHPENGKTLKDATKYMIRKYGKTEADH